MMSVSLRLEPASVSGLRRYALKVVVVTRAGDRSPGGPGQSFIHGESEKGCSRKLRRRMSKGRSPVLLKALNLSRTCLRMRCRACCNLDLLNFGDSADRPVPPREDDGHDDHSEHDEDSRLLSDP